MPIGLKMLKVMHLIAILKLKHLVTASLCAYGETSSGVKVLHGRKLNSYAFLYSKGVNGVSADGGNAGRGGKAGGGGKGGNISILTKNGANINNNHSVLVSSTDGQNGVAGKSGKFGGKDLAESRTDYLVVDGLGKRALRYNGFINALPGKGNPKRLDRGWYFCDPSIAKCFDSTLNKDKIEFLKDYSRDTYCATKFQKKAKDGEMRKTDESVNLSTSCRPINTTEVQNAYQLFASGQLEVQNNSSLIHFVEEMQQTIRKNLDELDSTCERQKFKRIQRNESIVQYKFDPFLDGKVDISTLAVTEFEEGISSEIIAQLQSLVSENFFFTKCSKSQLYFELEELVKCELEIQIKKDTPEESVCKQIYQLLAVMFNPTFFAYSDHSKSLRSTVDILEMAEYVTTCFHSDFFHKKMVNMKRHIKLRYEWFILSHAHERLLCTLEYTNHKFQRKSLHIFLKLSSQNTIKELNKVFESYFESSIRSKFALKIPSFKNLPHAFNDSCSYSLPLNSETTSLLEMSMILINDANKKSYGNFYFPNILQAIEKEFEAYHTTISDSDLMFIMIFMEQKLDNLLLDRTKLEDLFCKKMFSELEELDQYRKGFIFEQERNYRIESVDYLPEGVVKIAANTSNLKFNRCTFKIYPQNHKVTLNGKPVNFSEALLISKLDIEHLWKKIEHTFLEKSKHNNKETLDKFVDAQYDLDDECKEQLTVLLQKAQNAQDIPFDVFAFHPPSQWVEQLILSAARKNYDSKFVNEIQENICGLSFCSDKSLYHTFYNEFMQECSKEAEKYKTDLLEVLQKMRYIFITEKICSLITKQSKLQAGIESSNDIISEMIDPCGMFLPGMTEHAIEDRCKSHNIADTNFLKTAFRMQKCIRQLSGQDLQFWKHKLGEFHLWLCLQRWTCGNNEVCDILLGHTYRMQKHYNEQEVFRFVEFFCSGNIPGDELINLFSKCSSKEWIFSIVTHMINNKDPKEVSRNLHEFDWESKRTKERDVNEIIEHLKSQFYLHRDMEHLYYELEEIKNIVAEIKRIEKCPTQFSFQINDEQLKKELQSVPINEFKKCHISAWAVKFRRESSTENLVEAFAVIRRGITLFYETEMKAKGVVPRDTQMVASLLFFQSISAQGKAQGTKLFQQIETGEGKTMIVCMASIYKALLGEKVDIVTSSSVLATRDAANQKPLYEMFDVTVSHCCHEELSKRRKAYDADVIYGDIGSFQRDILETEFYDRGIRTERNYENVFVDEVDSMLVDKGQNMLYLPHAIPNLNCLDHMYLEVWTCVNAQDFIGLEQEQEQLYVALSRKLVGAVAPNAFVGISEINEKKSKEIFNALVKGEVISSEDYCLTTKDLLGIRKHLVAFISEKHIQNEVLMIIQEHIETKPFIQNFPEELHRFIKKSLKSWIHSAVCAKFFRPNKEYIIDIDRRESASDRYPRIVIMDNETGVEQESSEWGNGLHQFLQLKHNLRLSTESLKAVYMSNISFFTKHYKNLMGVTGTLREHTLFKKLYKDILIVEIPTNKPSRLLFEQPICKSSTFEWKQAVLADVQKKVQDHRVILIICEDIEKARVIQQFLSTKNFSSLLYCSSHEEKLETKGKFKSGEVIIATNIAGRGTDIKLSDEVLHNGGLHVCLSYLPPNERVELQAYGRAARGGDPGSCKIIFQDKDGDLHYAIEKRNLFEAHRVAEIEADYLHNIQLQERLFEKFNILYQQVKAKIKDKPEQRAILDYCLDIWAFFLDSYSNDIEAIPKQSTSRASKENFRIQQAFEDEVKIVMDKLKEFSLDQLPLSPNRLMQLGHCFMKQEYRRGKEFKNAGIQKNFKLAVNFYTQASAANNPFALYYCAAAKLNEFFYDTNTYFDKGEAEIKQIKQAYYDIIPLFKHRIKQCQTLVAMLQFANRHQDQSLTDNTQFFQEQKQHEIGMYTQFISSMQDIVGREITPSLFDHTDFKEEGANLLFKIVEKHFKLKQCRIAKSYQGRLSRFLSTRDTYFTYEAKIRMRVEQLRGKEKIAKDDLDGILPDKKEFWNQLIKHDLVSEKHVSSGSEEGDSNQIVVGYWNPQVIIDEVRLDSWDHIDTHSFDWINEYEFYSDFDEVEKTYVLTQLKRSGILSAEGYLKVSDLEKPLKTSLKAACLKHYKAIKDTLWHHAVYRFFLNHLHDSVQINVEDEVSDITGEHRESINEISVIDKLKTCDKTKIYNSPVSAHGLQKDSKAGAEVTSDISDHFPTKSLNKKFMELLSDNDLMATLVSGSELNCLINAMIQHAKQNYTTSSFPEAEAVRISVQQKNRQFDLSGMLHSDDEIAQDILECVNDKCCSEIGTVSSFIASIDGPLLYGGTSDKRFPFGRNVAIWQQGHHFVAIVHRHEFFKSSHQADSKDLDNIKKQVPEINQEQLIKLVQLNIVSKAQKGKSRILKPIEEITSILHAASLSAEDKSQMRNFLSFKLEIDYKTLNNCERELPLNQGEVLYNKLCEYAVIKEPKLKMKSSKIDKMCNKLKMGNSFYKEKFKKAIRKFPYYFEIIILNQYLESKGAKSVTCEEHNALKQYLKQRYFRSKSKLNSDITFLCPKSIDFLDDDQRVHVQNFVELMLQFKKNGHFISSCIKKQQSALLDLETPEISLRKLEDLQDDIQNKKDVLGWFSDNQCGLIISTNEQQWSKKSIFTAVGIVVFGVVQFAVGIALLAGSCGTFSIPANALISEGISDAIYGVLGLIRGYCKFTDYLVHKAMSVAFTVASAGIGPFLKGIRAPKYAMNAIVSAVKKVKWGRSISKAAVKYASISITKKVASAVADAGITIVGDKFFDEISRSIDDLSHCLIDSFDSMTNDEQFRKKAENFLRAQKPEKAQQYLQQVFQRVMENKTYLDIWDDIENKVGDCVCEAGASLSQLAKNEMKSQGIIMTLIENACRCVPIMTESVKIYLAQNKMGLLKAEMMSEFDKHQPGTHDYESLDQQSCNNILEDELALMKQEFSEQLNQRAKKIVSKGFQIVGQSIKRKIGKQLFGEEDKSHASRNAEVNLKELQNDEETSTKLSSQENQSAECKSKLFRLACCTRNPKAFALLIKQHKLKLSEPFLIPALETKINRPIKLVSKNGEPLLHVKSGTHVTGVPLVIKVIAAQGNQPKQFCVGKKLFFGNHGLIHAAMAGAGKEYTDLGVTKDIANACTDKNHPCYKYITRGIARSYVKIGVA